MSGAPTIRRLRTWLVGLFALAQIVGVSPLIYEHTLNVFGAAQAEVDHGHASPAAPDTDHHHGALDMHDQCCALHTLAGPLPSAAAEVAPAVRPGIRLTPVSLVALTDTEPDRLDRPPKLVSLT